MELRAPPLGCRKVLRGRLAFIRPPREADRLALPQRGPEPLQLIRGQEPLAPFLGKSLDAPRRVEPLGNAGNVRGGEAVEARHVTCWRRSSLGRTRPAIVGVSSFSRSRHPSLTRCGHHPHSRSQPRQFGMKKLRLSAALMVAALSTSVDVISPAVAAPAQAAPRASEASAAATLI